MTRTTDTIIFPSDDLAHRVNICPPDTTIELADGVHVLTAPLKPKDGVMLFSRKRGGAVILCKEDTGSHPVDGGNNVTIANIALMGHIGTHKQQAWINPNGTMQGLQVLHCDVSQVFYRALTIAPRMRIYDCTFKGIGVLGIGYTDVASYDVSIDHCEFVDIHGVNAGDLVEYGAMKLGNVRDSEVNDCYAHECKEAFWVDGEPDVENYGLRITNNLAENIEKSAIHYEISHHACIARNRIRNSGQPNEDWAWGASILIIDSSDSHICYNIVDCRHGGNGISIGKQTRKPYAYHNRVDSNHITYGDNSHSGIYDADNDRIGFFNTHRYYAGGNAYTRNNHYVPTTNKSRYGIEHRHTNFLNWQLKGQDVEGRELLHSAVPDDLKFPDDWKLNNDFVPPREKPPIVIDPPPQKPPTKKTYIVTVEEQL